MQDKSNLQSCQRFLVDMLEQVKAVRDSGACNMMNRKEVQFWAFHFCFYEAVEWIQQAPSKLYCEMLGSTNWAEVDCILTEDLKLKAAQSSGIWPDHWDI